MLKKLLENIKSFFMVGSEPSGLEAYIAANNPQTPLDVEMLERQYTIMQRARRDFNHYY